MSVETAIRASSQAFSDVVWPVVREPLGGGVIVPVETVTDSRMAAVLDTLGGVDLWHVVQGNIYPVASRVQYGTCWASFTVRYSKPSGARTEYHKRVDAIRRGALYPRYTIQAYVSGPDLLAAAIVKTETLIAACDEHKDQRRVNRADGSEFLYVKWNQIAATDIVICQGAAS